MKKLTRLLSLALAILMVMSLAGAAFATDVTEPAEPEETNGGRVGRVPGDTVITINGTTAGSAFDYYKLMEVTVSADGKHYSYVPVEKYKVVLRSVLGLAEGANDEAILEALRLPTLDAKKFAKELYAAIKAASLAADGSATMAADGKSATIEQKYGYFLIVQTAAGSGEGSATSEILLDTAAKSAVPLNVKVEVPESSKHVKDTNDSAGGVISGEQDGADWDIGDFVPFSVKGDVVADIGEYSKIVDDAETGHYYMIFHDTPSAGLSYVADKADFHVFINHQEGKAATVSEYEVPADKYEIITSTGDDCPFHVKLDLLHLADGLSGQEKENATAHGGDRIRVEFNLQLNKDAVAGSTGNPNFSWMEYSNNPFSESTGKTPKDKVIVFTYDLVVTKTDGEGNPLEGAEFTLYKHYETVVGDGHGGTTTKAEDKVVSLQSGKKGADGKVKFTWHGLDAGKYKLVETTVPDGYTKAEDIYFEVVSNYDKFTNDNDPKFKSLKINMLGKNWLTTTTNKYPFDVDQTTGMVNTPNYVISTTIQNVSGDVLPATGGIGTTLFYVFGSVLVIGAGVLLVSKKRMGAVD